MLRELNGRLLLFGALLCAIATAATPYVTLKYGMSVDLTYAGMFMAAAFLGRGMRDRALAVQLNILQTMVNVVSGVGFMCVILAAFFYIQGPMFNRPIGFNPAWWQVALWLLVSANLGVFMGAWPRRLILNDASLPWPTGKAVLSVAETLTDPAATETNARRRGVLWVTTAVAGFITFLKDGLGVITPIMASVPLKLGLGLELAGIGLGMLIPLSVGLSGLLGVWFVSAFGPTTARIAVLSSAAPEHLARCRELVGTFDGLSGSAQEQAMVFLTNHCGKAAEVVGSSPQYFKWMVMWFMWPATAMMIAASLTSVIVPIIRSAIERRQAQTAAVSVVSNHENERIPRSWIVVGITVSVLALTWLQDAWFGMPWNQVLLAVAIQPILIVAGTRVLGLTGQGPVSLMANATQFLFGLIWPAHVRSNLNAAHIAADPQASAESTIGSFWVAQRLGGRFRTLIVAQLIMIPIGAFLLPPVFNLLQHTYGIGLEKGQLPAPTGLKIAQLGIVMEKGLSALPPGALTASIIATILGVVMEIMIAVRRHNADGTTSQRFPWMVVPSAFGFALILPPILTLALALGSVISAAWRRFSTQKNSSYDLYAAPLAAGLVAGEAMVGAILVPAILVLLEILKPYLH